MFEDLMYIPDNDSFQLYSNNTLYKGYPDHPFTLTIYTIIPHIGVSVNRTDAKIEYVNLPTKKQIALYKLTADPYDLDICEEYFPSLAYDLIANADKPSIQSLILCSVDRIYIGTMFNRTTVELA